MFLLLCVSFKLWFGIICCTFWVYPTFEIFESLIHQILITSQFFFKILNSIKCYRKTVWTLQVGRSPFTCHRDSNPRDGNPIRRSRNTTWPSKCLLNSSEYNDLRVVLFDRCRRSFDTVEMGNRKIFDTWLYSLFLLPPPRGWSPQTNIFLTFVLKIFEPFVPRLFVNPKKMVEIPKKIMSMEFICENVWVLYENMYPFIVGFISVSWTGSVRTNWGKRSSVRTRAYLMFSSV